MHSQTYIRLIYSTVREKEINEHRPPEAYFLSYGLLTIKENMLTVSVMSFKQDFARLVSNCLLRWNIPGVIWIISNPLCVCCCKPWRSPIFVAWTVDFRYPQRFESKWMESGEGTGHADSSLSPIHCSGKTLFKNSRTARWKFGAAPSFLNRKWILACRSTLCVSYGSKPW